MRREKLLRAMNDLPEDLIAEGNVRRRHPLIRIAAVAVCLLVLASGLYPYFRGRGENLPAEGVTVNGAIYEIWAPGSTMARRTGLPDSIGKEMAGLQVEEIDQGTVHLYLPAENQRAVYLLRQENGTFRYLIFTGYYTSEGDAHVAADQMFLTYGVTKPEELVSVTSMPPQPSGRMVMVVSSVHSSSTNRRSLSKKPKAYPPPWAFSRLADSRAVEPYRRPTFTVSFTTAEALTALRAKNVTTNIMVSSSFFMNPPQYPRP